ncbi:MAG: GNAT family N-acetyltransferase [Lachnospiraceae bacterium]|nr:GNAT family N-acetyltransferase [Lachnospiraceae bacterium]
MHLRPYINTEDYKYIEKWLTDERTHALWCANRIAYPITQDKLGNALQKGAEDWGDAAYVVTEDNGRQIGFFVLALNATGDSGFLKYLVLDKELRGRGYGMQMLRLILRYAFDVTGVDRVQLNVFDVNSSARNCYSRMGFIEDNVMKDAFSYHKEMWSRCHMVLDGKKWRRRSARLILES